MDIVRVNDERHLVQVATDKDTVKDGPTFDDDRDITLELENEVYSYYSLRRATTDAKRAPWFLRSLRAFPCGTDRRGCEENSRNRDPHDGRLHTRSRRSLRWPGRRGGS